MFFFTTTFKTIPVVSDITDIINMKPAKIKVGKRGTNPVLKYSIYF